MVTLYQRPTTNYDTYLKDAELRQIIRKLLSLLDVRLESHMINGVNSTPTQINLVDIETGGSYSFIYDSLES